MVRTHKVPCSGLSTLCMNAFHPHDNPVRSRYPEFTDKDRLTTCPRESARFENPSVESRNHLSSPLLHPLFVKTQQPRKRANGVVYKITFSCFPPIDKNFYPTYLLLLFSFLSSKPQPQSMYNSGSISSLYYSVLFASHDPLSLSSVL